jgi:hypothetical protein
MLDLPLIPAAFIKRNPEANRLPDNYLGLLTWTLVDLTCGVIAANLPTLSILIPRRWKNSSQNSYSSASKRQQTKPKSSVDYVQAFDPNRDPIPRSWSKESQEGIVRHVDIELQYQDADSTK